MLWASPRVKTAIRMSSTSHMAREATNGLSKTTASIRAMSTGTPFRNTARRFERYTESVPAYPWATAPAASPAIVPSRKKGKTLFVPVEMGSRGTFPQLLATMRFVPSPPSVTMHPAPASARAAAALQESSCVAVSSISSGAIFRFRESLLRMPATAFATMP